MARTVTLPKAEYQKLRDIARRFELARRLFQADMFAEPPTRNPRRIIRELRGTKRYSEALLKSIARGLRESSYFASR